ncbi:MAG: N-acetylmuramoyl-L-alanine amidase [Planctomycetota bacterium]
MWLPLLLQLSFPAAPAAPTDTPSSLPPITQTFTVEQLQDLQSPQGVVSLHSVGAFRSVGFWWEGELEQAEVRLFGVFGEFGRRWPIVAAHDLNLTTEGPAGVKQVSSLVHGSVDLPKVGIHLHLPALDQLQSLTVVWIPMAVSLTGPSPAQSAPTLSASTTTALPKPPVYSRASWGASAAQCSPSYCNTTHVAMHHTASSSEYHSSSWAQCASNVLATQTYHMFTRGWCDVGYNYLICPHGDIFEGRGGGDDVRGAHDGYNCGSMGVAMMGYFHTPHNQTLTPAMENAFVALTGWKCDQQGINPLGTSWYAGLGAQEQNLYGHRDVSSTACPGDLAYAELPRLRNEVDQLIQGGSGTTIILDNGQASYTGNWTLGTSSSDKYGSDYRWASTGVAPARALWNPNLAQAGSYEVSLWWPAGSNRNPATQIGLLLNGQLFSTTINQQLHGGQWNILGTVQMPAGSGTTLGITNSGPLGWVVVADALRLVRQ